MRSRGTARSVPCLTGKETKRCPPAEPSSIAKTCSGYSGFCSASLLPKFEFCRSRAEWGADATGRETDIGAEGGRSVTGCGRGWIELGVFGASREDHG